MGLRDVFLQVLVKSDSSTHPSWLVVVVYPLIKFPKHRVDISDLFTPSVSLLQHHINLQDYGSSWYLYSHFFLIMKRYYILWNVFFCIYWDDLVIFIFHSINMVSHFDWFRFVEPFLHLRGEYHLVMVYNLFVLWFGLLMFCWEFLHLYSSRILFYPFLFSGVHI